jgi:N-glycosylase/DNA lyase
VKALQQLYFPKRKVKIQRLHRFAAEHFGTYGGYAQQYLFHYVRTKGKLEIRNLKSEANSKSE